MHMTVPQDTDSDNLTLRDHRPLYLMTAVLAVLIALDLILAWLGRTNEIGGFRLALLAAVLGGGRVLFSSLEGVFEGRIGSDLALALACMAAIAIREPLVAAEVVFIAMCGESLEAVTFGRTQRELRALLELRPHVATVIRDGQEAVIHTDDLVVGDRIVIRPGERIPADGRVLSGWTSIDESALTGESLPVDKAPGSTVFTGTLNQNGAIEIEASKVGRETTFGQLVRLIHEARERKAPIERTADRYARYFLPVVLVCAGVTYLIWRDVSRTVAVLVVACPCALILATPAAILAAVARLARQGVVLRGGLAIERLATASALVFDKTGTLTEGRPTLGDVVPMVGHDADLILRTAALAEQRSEHVLAEVIVRAAADRGLPIAAVEAVEALPGAGVRARVGEQTILVGNRRLLEAHGISISPEMAGALSRLDSSGQTALIVVRNAEPIGAIGVRDTVRSEARQTLDELRQMGFEDVALVTGDRWAAAQNVAQQFGITFVRAEQLPADKARIVEEWRRQGKRVAMVGDGINDAPALAVSDVGLALGGVGSNIAAEAGDVILMRDPLRPLPFTVRMARQTLSIIKQDILVFAFGVNATAIVLSAWGMLPPIYAALYHQIGSLLVLLNSMRLLFFERWDELAVVRRLRRLDDAAGQVLDWLNPMTASAAIIAHWRRLARLGAAMMLAGYGLLTLSVIDADEQGVLQRFGKSIGVLEPGLHWHLPPPFDRVHRLRPNQVRVLEIGFRSLPVADPEAFRDLTIEWNSPHREGMIQREENEAVMVTGDESMVDLETLVFYRVADARQFLFGVSDPLAMLRAIAESVLRSQAAHTPEDAILTTGRSRVESQALSMIRARVGPDQCYLGVEVLDVVLRDVHPPLDVVRAYHDVSSAMEEREQIINIAKSYDISTVLAAQSQRDRAARQAEAYQTRTVRNAEGARDAYLLQHESYRLASRLTHERWYWEAVETVLANRPKIVLDPKASRNRRILLGDFGSTMLAPEFAEPAPPAATMPQEH